MRRFYPPPDPSVVFWRKEKPDGTFDYASIQSIQKTGDGNWKALFLVPGQAPFYINQNNGELNNWEPILALTEENLESMVERIAQRVTAILQETGVDSSEIVPAAMAVVQEESVADAIETAVEATSDYEKEEEEATDATDPDYWLSKDFKRNKKMFECGVCGKKYAYEKSLKKHIAKCHNVLEEKLSKNAE